MRQIEHNAPGFHYKIYWKMDAPGENWNIEEIFDWKSSRLQIPDQPTYQRYMIKIGMYVLNENVLLHILLKSINCKSFYKITTVSAPALSAVNNQKLFFGP